MPYVPDEQRPDLDDSIHDLCLKIEGRYVGSTWQPNDCRDNDGRLNYSITELLCHVLDLDNDPRYTKLNTALGVLEGVKLELYRRLGGPYEDLAIDKSEDIGVYKRFTTWLVRERKRLGLWKRKTLE